MAPTKLSTTLAIPKVDTSGATTPIDSPYTGSSDDGDVRTPLDSPFSSFPGSPPNGAVQDLSQPDMNAPIAIVGVAMRAGSATNALEFYEMLSRNRSTYTPNFPKERFNNDAFYHPNAGKLGCINAIGGHFIKQDITKFDAPFFSMTELEATSLDPQQRLLLECAFETLESAGVPRHTTVGQSIGCFIGSGVPEYEHDLFRDSDAMPMFQATGNASALQSNRISHFFDWRGPSVTMDTACSSSLVAMHYACQSIRTGESKAALVGGANLNILPEYFINFSTSRLFSNEGRSFSFDQRGTGYGRGEGCGMILLKPLSAAIRDRDCIRAVVRATGVNQDGKTPGITMPSGESQEALMRQIYKNACLNPAETGYVEAHGTGTRVGDPIEVTALNNVFGKSSGAERTVRNPLWLGSVKSNIGHLESASGILAVIKAALSLERGFILPNYDFKSPNVKIPFAAWGMKVPTTPRPWPRGKKYASINNFGFGGTNAHVVLEKAPLVARSQDKSSDVASPRSKLFVLTANDKVACQSLMKSLVVYLEQRPEMFQKDLMSDVAYTLGQRRSRLSWRIAVPANSSSDLVARLNGAMKPVKEAGLERLGFVFTGQGAQWWAMGRELYEQYPIYRHIIDAAGRILKELGAPYSLVEELGKDEQTTSVNDAHISQPACTAIQLALVELFKSWGIRPTDVVGHSSGEIAAAYAAGILNLDSAMTIAYHRGRLVPVLKARHPALQGSMLAVGCGKDVIDPLLNQVAAKALRVACYNSPQSLTISGDTPAIVELQQLLDERSIFNRKLLIETAYHSHHMELIANDYKDSIKHLPPPAQSNVRFHSSLTGKTSSWSELTADYWVQNLTSSVKFAQAFAQMVAPTEEHKTGVEMLLELGPHAALQGPIKQTLAEAGPAAAKIPYAAALLRKKNAIDTALEVASTLFCNGLDVNLEYINFPRASRTPRLLVDLPTYPWNHSTRHWHESRITKAHKFRKFARQDLLGVSANYANDLEPIWRNIVRLDDVPWLRHHKIQSLTIFPISGFASMVIEAVSQRTSDSAAHIETFELHNLVVHTPLVMLDEDVEMTTTLTPSLDRPNTSFKFRIHSHTKSKGWTEHVTGHANVTTSSANHVEADRVKIQLMKAFAETMEAIRAADTCSLQKDQIYSSLELLGVSYGPTFQGLTECRANEACSTANLVVADTAMEMPEQFETSYVIKPSFLEQLVEMYWPILGAGRTPLDTICLPASIDRLTIAANVAAHVVANGQSLKAYATTSSPLSSTSSGKVSMFAAAGLEPIITIEGLTITPLPNETTAAAEDVVSELCYKQVWEPILEMGIGSTDTDATSLKLAGQPVIIIRGSSPYQMDLSQRLANAIQSKTGQMPSVSTLTDLDASGKLVLNIAEIDQSVLANLCERDHTAVKRIVNTCDGITWIIRGALDQNVDPTTSMINGFSRTIRGEQFKKFATLDLDGDVVSDIDTTTLAILKVFEATMSLSNIANQEMEYRERKGALWTPRIVDDPDANEYVRQRANPLALRTTAFGKDDRALKLMMPMPGSVESLYFVDDSAVESDLADDEIEIQVQAIGVDHRDFEAAFSHQDDHMFGREVSGLVTRTGKAVSNIVPGDRVAAISQGSYSTFARAKASMTFKIGADISFEDAATVPFAFTTAYHAMIDIVRLDCEDTVLILDGASPTGQAAILLAQMIGAPIVTTAESQEAKALLIESYEIPPSHIFYSKNADLGRAVLGTLGHGVDVILNLPVEKHVAQAALQALNSYGRVVTVGSGHSLQNNASCNRSNTSFTSLNLNDLMKDRPLIVSRVLKDATNLLRYGKIRPLVGRTSYSISDVATVFSEQHSRTALGKSIVVIHAEAEVRASASSKIVKLFKEDATYILIGGTGGLGRSMTRWMAGKGAKTIVLLSRTGSLSGDVKVLYDEMAAIGVNVVVRSCDVSNKEAVDALIQTGLSDLPPIRGVIHGSMVLRDALFENQTYTDYNAVISSKVHGAWNFHRALLHTPLDFFILVSSSSAAMGPRGQSAYAAANSMLDAFAAYRRSLGLPGVSFGPTAVSDAGYLFENSERRDEIMRNIGSDTISEAEVLALLESAVDGTAMKFNGGHSITGVRIDPIRPSFWSADAKYKHLRIRAEQQAAELAAANPGQAAAVSWSVQVKSADSLADAEAAVCAGLVEKIAATLGVEKDEVESGRTLSSYSLDSLTAIDVRNFIAREFEATMQVLELLASGTIETLAKAVCVKSKIINFN